MSADIKKIYTSRGLKPPKCRKGVKHHSAAFHRMVAGMKRSRAVRNPYAVAMAKLGKKAFK